MSMCEINSIDRPKWMLRVPGVELNERQLFLCQAKVLKHAPPRCMRVSVTQFVAHKEPLGVVAPEILRVARLDDEDRLDRVRQVLQKGVCVED